MVGSDEPELPTLSKGPHVLVRSLDVIEIDDDVAHHLGRVRRLRRGDPLTVGDGQGRWAPGVWRGDAVELAGAVVAVPPPASRVGVAFALVKGNRPELVVQKLTELGVDRIVPFVAERSVVRWDEVRGARQHGRLQRVAVEAAAQSRRVWLPVVEEVTTFAEAASAPGAALADLDGASLTAVPELVLIGPEGGWSDAERACGLPAVGFGGTVLRAETAAIAAGALLCAVRAGVVSPPSG